MDLSDALDGFSSSGNQSGGGGGAVWPGQPPSGPVWPGQPPANPVWSGGNPAQPSGPGGFPGPGSGGFPGPNPGPGSGGFPGPGSGGFPGPGSGGFPGPNPGPGSGGFPGPNPGPGSGGFPGPGSGGFPSPSPNPGPGSGGFPGPGSGGFPSPSPNLVPGSGGWFSPQQNLTVPFDQPLPNGVYNKLLIIIAGTIKANANKITVDLSTDRDLAFHFNPRFNESGRKVIVRNSCIDKKWGKEERDLNAFPFTPGRDFELKILCTDTGFKVAVNNSHLFEYRHRIHDLRAIKKLSIYNDLTLSKVTMETLP